MVTLKRFAERIRDDACFIPTFGPEPQVIQAKRALAHEVLETFQRTFPSLGDREVAACFVPGRVEVLGKHTDYAGGHSLLAAVDRGFFCISSTNSSDRVRLVEIDARFGACEIPFSAEVAPTVGHW